ALQIQELQLGDRISISIVDDASPNINEIEMIKMISPFKDFAKFEKNRINKGMSLNIRDMVAASKADFCTVLTDDDHLQPETLQDILKTLDNLDDEIGCFFVPRYSYLNDKSLHCIVCSPFTKNMTIKSSPLNSIKYLHNGFVLTGLFFKPKLINFQLWNDNLENSFFPIIYFADLLLKSDCLFLNKNWFVHTVKNKCHWESWGETEKDIVEKLYSDYISAVSLSTEKALSRVTSELITLQILLEEIFLYLKQMNSSKEIIAVAYIYQLKQSRFTYKLAINIFKINNMLFIPLKRLAKSTIKYLNKKRNDN
ncbi:MAG: glycosyltransferase, partial [Pseudanabaenaceae cyanobacterium bins.68]|nr:glycosyltransferase [Pseudanabaenaceae cyanobacterium bins.68]